MLPSCSHSRFHREESCSIILQDCGEILGAAENFWRDLFEILVMELHFSISFHPQTMARPNECYLRHYLSVHQKDWARLLDMAQFLYNLQRSEYTGRTPFELATVQQSQISHSLRSAFEGKSLGAYHRAKGWEKQLDTAKSYLDKKAK